MVRRFRLPVNIKPEIFGYPMIRLMVHGAYPIFGPINRAQRCVSAGKSSPLRFFSLQLRQWPNRPKACRLAWRHPLGLSSLSRTKASGRNRTSICSRSCRGSAARSKSLAAISRAGRSPISIASRGGRISRSRSMIPPTTVTSSRSRAKMPGANRIIIFTNCPSTRCY